MSRRKNGELQVGKSWFERLLMAVAYIQAMALRLMSQADYAIRQSLLHYAYNRYFGKMDEPTDSHGGLLLVGTPPRCIRCFFPLRRPSFVRSTD
jgi:hypothetical protein